MAYNIYSLIQIVEQILQPDQQLFNTLHENNKPQLESLLEKATAIKEIVENLSPADYKRTKELDSLIRGATYDAEDVIETHMVKQIILKSRGKSFITMPQAFSKSWRCFFFKKNTAILSRILQRLLLQFDAAMEELTKIVDGTPTTSLVVVSYASRRSAKHIVRKISSLGSSSARNLRPQDIVVGLEEDLLQLKNKLTGEQSKLEVIPIVGMGGIGKTTLARNLYNDPLIVHHFDNCAWAAISQEFDLRAVVVRLLKCIISNVTAEMLNKDTYQLADIMRQSLFGKRYLIVLDDMWTTNAWDAIQRFFPDKNDGSRIILTTRESTVATYVNPLKSHHEMQLLNEVESWNLLRGKVFGTTNDCPPELEEVGKTIASNCKGLPLAIQVIGGVLLEASTTKDFWTHVAADVSSAACTKDDRLEKILSLSYDHLPLHLKPCFLYVGGFPEDYDIRASKLKRLCVAEGFLKPIHDKTLEEAAEEYLQALVDRNLLLVKGDVIDQVKSYSIHDLLRDLCKRKAEQEKFTTVRDEKAELKMTADAAKCIRRIIVHPSFEDVYSTKHIKQLFVRSFVFIYYPRKHGPELNASTLLRVLDLITVPLPKFSKIFLKLVNLRYLALCCDSGLPPAIFRLWNLQTLIFTFNSETKPPIPLALPSDLCSLKEIRHIKLKNSYFSADFCKKLCVLENLQTLYYVDSHNFTDSDFVEKFPNLKELGIFRSGVWEEIVDLSRLLNLETLYCKRSFEFDYPGVLPGIIFPPSLRKLSLSCFKLTWKFMSTIGSLPNLEVLKIENCEFVEEDMLTESIEWEPVEGEFLSLQFLTLKYLYLSQWSADETHYPSLRLLVIRCCLGIEEIPPGIGDIPTLETIELIDCIPSTEASARQIQEEQHKLGNYDLKVRIRAEFNI